MEVPGPVALLLLLLLTAATPPCQPLQDLNCYSDYVKNISCIWKSSGKPPEEHCVLQEERGQGKSCELRPTKGPDRNLRTCQLVFIQVYGFRYKVTIKVVCGSSVVTSLKDYRPALNVKMHPPGKPVVSKSNVSWSLGSPHSHMIPSYYFQLEYKQADQPWQNAESRNLTVKQKSAELPESMLEKGRWYEARVRVKTSEFLQLKGVWSNWSPTASWRSEVGRDDSPLILEKTRSSPGLGPELQVTLGAVAAFAFLSLITCKLRRAGWVHRLKRSHVPNPSTYFHSLNSVHGGNFQKWLGPMFAPESFDVPQSFEDISAVEVFKAKDVTALLRASDPPEPWDSSAGSACFSNMGYFYSEYPSSCEIEVCPVYFSYRAYVECSDGLGSVEGGAEGNGPSPATASYEQLLGLPGGSGHPNPGCGEWSEEEEEDEEEEGEGETEDGQKETPPPLTTLPFLLPGPLTPAGFPLPPHLPSIPQRPSHDFDSDPAPGSSSTSRPLEGSLGRSSSERIEPTSGGYMSVMEMLNTYCNKSI